MDNKVLPNEVYVTEFGALIRTRCPKDNVTDAMIHQRVLAANLSAGDTVKVQCMSHGRDTVLWFTEYLVYDRSSQIKRVDVNDRDIRQVNDVNYSIMRMSDWKQTPAVRHETHETVVIVWNPGKKKHEVKRGDEVLYEDADKHNAERFIGAASISG